MSEFSAQDFKRDRNLKKKLDIECPSCGMVVNLNKERCKHCKDYLFAPTISNGIKMVLISILIGILVSFIMGGVFFPNPSYSDTDGRVFVGLVFFIIGFGISGWVFKFSIKKKLFSKLIDDLNDGTIVVVDDRRK